MKIPVHDPVSWRNSEATEAVDKLINWSQSTVMFGQIWQKWNGVFLILFSWVCVCYIRRSRLCLRWGWVTFSWTPWKSSARLITVPRWQGCRSPSFGYLCVKDLQPQTCTYTLKNARFHKDTVIFFCRFYSFHSHDALPHVHMFSPNTTVTASCPSHTAQIPLTPLLEQ